MVNDPASFPLLLPQHLLSSLISSWLAEDNPAFDYSAAVTGDGPAKAFLLCKAPAIFCGRPFFDEIFKQLDCTVEWGNFRDGDTLTPELISLKPGGKQFKGVVVATVSGKINNILLGERLALNILARLSGISTKSRRLVDLARQSSQQVLIAGTRKTTPGFRLAEKYAMVVGGADPHRHDLSSMVMLKDNHVWHCGSIPATVTKTRGLAGFSTKVEVECQSVDEAKEAISAGADVVMLDNFAPGEELANAALEVKHFARSQGRTVLVEISGGVTEENIRGYICEGVDIISTSSIHQGVPHIDFSLKIDH